MPELRHNSANTKHRLRMEIKEISPTGEFEGLLSVYNNVDQGGDMVEPGAFTKTIQERGSQVPMLWQHKSDVPIGMLTLQDGPDALRVKGQLLMELPEAQKAYLLIKAKIVKGLSIGFETVKDAMDGAVRHLKELRLFEGSIVTFPMNELAMITAVKNADGTERKDFNDELTQIQLWDGYYQLMSALDAALCDVRWSDLSAADQDTASKLVIDQFSEQYMAYLPAYNAMLAQLYGGMEVMARRTAIEAKAKKAGRTISAATWEKIQGAIDLLSALRAEEAGSSTSESEAAKAAPSEPVEDHSAATEILEGMRSLYRVA